MFLKLSGSFGSPIAGDNEIVSTSDDSIPESGSPNVQQENSPHWKLSPIVRSQSESIVRQQLFEKFHQTPVCNTSNEGVNSVNTRVQETAQVPTGYFENQESFVRNTFNGNINNDNESVLENAQVSTDFEYLAVKSKFALKAQEEKSKPQQQKQIAFSAVQQKDYDSLKKFVKSGGDTNMRSDRRNPDMAGDHGYDKPSLLMTAVNNRDLKAVKVLLKSPYTNVYSKEKIVMNDYGPHRGYVEFTTPIDSVRNIEKINENFNKRYPEFYPDVNKRREVNHALTQRYSEEQRNAGKSADIDQGEVEKKVWKALKKDNFELLKPTEKKKAIEEALRKHHFKSLYPKVINLLAKPSLRNWISVFSRRDGR